jgi:hypothetical protein
MDKVLNVVGLLILLREASFSYTIRRVPILLKKPRFIVDKPYRFDSFDVER